MLDLLTTSRIQRAAQQLDGPRLKVYLILITTAETLSLKQISIAANLHISTTHYAVTELLKEDWIERHRAARGQVYTILQTGLQVDKEDSFSANDRSLQVDKEDSRTANDGRLQVDKEDSRTANDGRLPISAEQAAVFERKSRSNSLENGQFGSQSKTSDCESTPPIGFNPTEDKGLTSYPAPEATTAQAKLQPLPTQKLALAQSLAANSAKELKDGESDKWHQFVWQRAMQIDQARGTDEVSRNLFLIVSELRGRRAKTGQPQGAAFTARAKRLFSAAGYPVAPRRPSNTGGS